MSLIEELLLLLNITALKISRLDLHLVTSCFPWPLFPRLIAFFGAICIFIYNFAYVFTTWNNYNLTSKKCKTCIDIHIYKLLYLFRFKWMLCFRLAMFEF